MRATCAVIGFCLVGQVMFAEETLSIREYSERCVSYYARMYGVSPALVRAIIQIESGGNRELCHRQGPWASCN